MVNATQNVPVVLQIANLSTMTVVSAVSEVDVTKLYKGIAVFFTTLGANNRRWYGELKRIEPTPKVQNGMVLYTRAVRRAERSLDPDAADDRAGVLRHRRGAQRAAGAHGCAGCARRGKRQADWCGRQW